VCAPVSLGRVTAAAAAHNDAQDTACLYLTQFHQTCPGRLPQAQYVVLKRDDILQRQHKAISEVTSILGLNEDEAARVLRKFKW
jgi:hypothetical protein